ncbi:MAG: polysaccharide biosynthesis protein [Methanobacterium paludis]|jgi:UDP-N-acetylglucosamine 4,6-dehydratase/5-epimerase|nr:polysaccharide biosynthesis protein [Methanobacterium paludis]
MKIEKHLKDKNILIIGGTGSFGHQIVTELVKIIPNKISILSRDEKKQYDMKNEFEEYEDLLNFVIGDIRNYPTVHDVMRNTDIVYHAAALKQVPNCEIHPFEAVKTNIIGAENVRRAAIENDVDTVVSVSTDKAVKPVNAMGMTKALQEKIMLNLNNKNFNTKFICVRYGNVVGSRGSVIPFFKNRIEKKEYLPVTSYKMTRFLLRLEEAIYLVFKATLEGETGQLFVKKMPACYIVDLAKVMSKKLTGNENYPMKEVGIRPGEKIHEILVSEEEMRRAIETDNHYVIYNHGELDKPILIRDLNEYGSNNTKILNDEEIFSLLTKSGCF